MPTPPPPGPRHAAPPARRRGRSRRRFGIGLWLVVGLGVLAVGGAGVAAAGVIAQPTPLRVPPAAEAPTPARPPMPVPAVGVRVRYEILGPPTAGLLTFTRGGTALVEPRPPVSLPWRNDFSAGSGFIPTVTAQSPGDGAITCRITVGGTVVSEVTSDGPQGVASCTGHVIAAH